LYGAAVFKVVAFFLEKIEILNYDPYRCLRCTFK